ncbi:hypothetical protein ANCCEY_14768 [Ancylostoma ceylanicum]|uniref:F-actin-capping protein subunit beta n=1 Tax=Ancylostoma ceylanicum TaxID=53326 RepID=A0A0D6L906_9BILA|nr:hypothetical protein ANCCEY_14768 [Ancylostoma ceylanicum]
MLCRSIVPRRYREEAWLSYGKDSQSEQQLDCALDLMRRLPPQQCEKNLIDLIDLCPGLCDDLLAKLANMKENRAI